MQQKNERNVFRWKYKDNLLECGRSRKKGFLKKVRRVRCDSINREIWIEKKIERSLKINYQVGMYGNRLRID